MQTNKENSGTQSVHFVPAASEMVTLMNAYNWASSPLGPVNNWSQSLRTTLSIILNSKFPMFLFWGKHLVYFYNDAFSKSLGVNGKHQDAMGKKGGRGMV